MDCSRETSERVERVGGTRVSWQITLGDMLCHNRLGRRALLIEWHLCKPFCSIVQRLCQALHAIKLDPTEF